MLTQETPNDKELLNNKETALSQEQFQQMALSIIQVHILPILIYLLGSIKKAGVVSCAPN